MIEHGVVDGPITDAGNQGTAFHLCQRAAAEQRLHQRINGAVESVFADDLVDDADLLCAVSRDHFCGHEIAVGLPRTHGANHVGADHRRYDAQFHFTEAETGVVCCHGHVRRADQAQGSTKSGPLYAGNDRLGALINGLHQRGQTQGVLLILLRIQLAHGTHPVQVRAGGKVLAGSL